jgi:hypothetical protein
MGTHTNGNQTRDTAPALRGAESGRKVRVTFYLGKALLDELRDVTVALSGPPDRLTLSQLAEHALQREVRRLRRLHRGGREFARREQELRPGRPIR